MSTATIDSTLRNHPSLIPLKCFAAIIDTHYQTVYAWVREGHIPYTRVGSRIKFDGATVADWLKQRQLGKL